jgi:endonuclease/exonuclease/phosphatase family metal-dependent hydrolase
MPEFTLLSLNTFGLPLFLGWNRLGRLMRQLDRFPASVLCFQEIQQNAYVPLLRRGLPDYEFHSYERSVFAPKGGLYTAARHPLHDSQFVGYQNRGKALSPGFADWVLNKGVLISRLEHQGRPIVVMNTHLHANYAGNWDPTHSMTRIQRDQVRHLADLARAQPSDALVIVCGDFNFPRGSRLYQELLEAGGLTDPLARDERPTYRPFPLLPSAKWSIPIDFCLVRRPDWKAIELSEDIVTIQDSARSLPHQRFLTDHNALTLHVTWQD